VLTCDLCKSEIARLSSEDDDKYKSIGMSSLVHIGGGYYVKVTEVRRKTHPNNIGDVLDICTTCRSNPIIAIKTVTKNVDTEGQV
jgi:hypothetical protein